MADANVTITAAIDVGHGGEWVVSLYDRNHNLLSQETVRPFTMSLDLPGPSLADGARIERITIPEGPFWTSSPQPPLADIEWAISPEERRRMMEGEWCSVPEMSEECGYPRQQTYSFRDEDCQAEEERRLQRMQEHLNCVLGATAACMEQQREADERAEVLLLEHLDEGQRRTWKKDGCFSVKAASGLIYRLDLGGGVMRSDKRHFCIQPEEDVPWADAVLARKLLLEADEAKFLEIANDITYPRPLAERDVRLDVGAPFCQQWSA